MKKRCLVWKANDLARTSTALLQFFTCYYGSGSILFVKHRVISRWIYGEIVSRAIANTLSSQGHQVPKLCHSPSRLIQTHKVGYPLASVGDG